MHWFSRTALEMIAQCGLGYSMDSLIEGSDLHPYVAAAKKLVYASPRVHDLIVMIYKFSRPLQFRMFLFRAYLLPTFTKLGPPNFRRFVVNLLPFKAVRDLRDVVDVMHNTSVEILESKKRALREGDKAVARQIGRGKDIISILSMCNRTFFVDPSEPPNGP
jgi:hypothetical protein